MALWFHCTSESPIPKWSYHFHRPQVQFEYSWCLVRSGESADVRKGVNLLQEIYDKGSEEEKRDYIYYLALGYTKLKEYLKAKKFIDAILYKVGTIFRRAVVMKFNFVYQENLDVLRQIAYTGQNFHKIYNEGGMV